MPVDFSRAKERPLKVLARDQRVITNILTVGTRRVSGKDDTRGRFHNAATSSWRPFRKNVYALTWLVDFYTAFRKHDDTVVVFAEFNDEVHAVLLEVRNGGKSDGLEYGATGICRVPGLPEGLYRSAEFAGKACDIGSMDNVTHEDYRLDNYNMTPGAVSGARSASGNYGKTPARLPGASPYGTKIAAP